MNSTQKIRLKIRLKIIIRFLLFLAIRFDRRKRKIDIKKNNEDHKKNVLEMFFGEQPAPGALDTMMYKSIMTYLCNEGEEDAWKQNMKTRKQLKKD